MKHSMRTLSTDEADVVETLRSNTDILFGYVDQTINEILREERIKSVKRVWSASFGERYGYYPVVLGSKCPVAYIRRFLIDDRFVDIIEFMKDDLTDKVLVFLNNDSICREFKTFIEAEELAAEFLKPKE